jgi:PAS domain S-box-containing protein
MFRLLVCQSTRLLEQLHGINNSPTRLILTALLVAAAYYFGALFSFALRVPSTRSSIIWAPNAVLLAALVVTPYRTWWIWLVAALPAHLLAQARDGASIVLLLCPFLANVAQAALAAAGMRRFTDAPHRLESFRDMGIFILVAVLAVPAVVSFAAAWLFVAAGWENNYWLVAWARLLNNVLTGLAVAPLCLAIASGDLSKLRRLHVSHFIELAIILIGLAGILSAVSASQASETVRFALRLYAPLPFLIWAAVRFGPAGLSITLLIVAYDAISDSIAGHGPFTTGSPVGNVLALEASLSALSLPLMLLAALMREGKRKEKALRESEARYRALVTASSEIVWLANADGEGFFVTPAWQELTGQSEEESRNSGWLNAVHPDDRQRCERLWNEAMAQRNVYENELRVRGLDGSYRHFYVHAVPILSSQGSVHEWVGAVTDITDRKRSEHILRESEERFRNMAEYAPVMIWISAPDGACTYVNKRWTDFTGTTGEQAYGFHRLDGVHEKDCKLTSEIITHANQRREGFRVEYHMRRYDGEYRWVIDSASPRFDPDGEFLGYIGSIIDITERKQAEEALRESEERFARTEKFSLVMVTHTDLEGRWLKIPPTLCQLLGYTEQELLGRSFAEVTHPDDINRNLRERTRLLAGELKSFDLEKRYICKNGGIVWVYINVSAVTNLSGRPVHCLSYIKDITERKRAEQSLRESEERLQLALEAGGMGIWDWNKQTNELQWSSEHFTIMGLAPFSVNPTYRTWAERLHPDDLPVVAAEMKQAIAERRHYRSEYRVFLSDRSTRWVTSRGEPIYNRAGQCVRVMGVVVDTTERKRAEARLNVQYNVTRALSASFSLSDGSAALIETVCECFDWHYGEIWQVDPENNELRYLDGCSPSGASTGFISDSRQFTFARGVGLPGRVWKSGRPEWMTNIAIEPGFQRAALAEKAGLKCAFAFPVSRGERTLAVMAFFSREIRQPDQEMLHIMESIGSQIGQFAERKEAENALRASEERHRAILESSLDSIVTIDHRGTIIEFNPAAEQTFGYKRQDAIGKQVGELLVPPALRGKHFRGLAHFLTKGEATILDKRVEMTAMRADGSEIPIELAVTRIRLDGPPMFTGYIRDISQRKRADEALRHALTEVQRLKEKVEADNVYLREELSETHRYGEIVGRSIAIEKVLRQVRQVAVTDMTALILGETGTGKELVARAIHESSARRQRPLVKVNCSALPAELMESELFGHERGAFTGALTKRVGRFEVADGGTIFLDEIGDLALSLQAKLLRVLQEGEFERLGSSKTIRVNVRVIAATNRDLSDAMRKEAFRSDLYYRLAVYPIAIPPLRDRKEDIGQLAESFLCEASRRLGRSFEAIPRRVHEALRHYDWPGNVRELQNVIERAAVTSTGRFLQLPEEWHPEPEPNKAGVQLNGIDYPLGRTGSTLEDLERAHIIQVLNQTRWRIEGTKGAAMILGLHPSTLRSRMNKLGISRSESIEL